MNERVALVTGGSRGIGRATCLELARRSVDICVNYAGNAEAADKVVAECEALGVSAMAVRADVADELEVRGLIDSVCERFERIDILVNNAGITRDGLAVQMSAEDFDACVDTNLKGSFYCMREAGKRMMRQRYGRIVNVSSVVALHGNPGQVNYVASKAGLIGMTMTVAKELGKRGVTVNAVAPGFIETKMTDVLSEDVVKRMRESIPLARMGTPEDVARVIAFLASDDASYITGQVIRVDGGMGM